MIINPINARISLGQQRKFLIVLVFVFFLSLVVVLTTPTSFTAEEAFIDAGLLNADGSRVSVIVTAVSADTAAAAVAAVGGQVTSDLSLINAVGATIDGADIHALAALPGIVSVINNHTVSVSGGPNCPPDTPDHAPCASRPGWVTDRQEKHGNVILPVDLKYAAGLAQLPDGGFVAIAEKEYVAFANPDGSIRLLIDDLDFDKPSSPPLVNSDGDVFFMAELAGSDDKSIVYALDSNGNVLWDYTQKNLVQGLGLSPDGAWLYILSAGNKAKLYILDATDGELLGKAEPPTKNPGLFTHPPLVNAEGTVFLQSSGREPDKDNRYSNVIALNPAESLLDNKAYLWQYKAFFDDGDTEILYSFDMAPLLANGKLYLFSDHDKVVFALDAGNGQLQHAFELENGLESQPIIGQDGTLYLPSDNHIYALHPDLTLKFNYVGEGKFSTPVFALDGTAAYIYAGNTVQAIDPITGADLWQVALKGDIKRTPVLDDGGNIIIGSEGKDLVIIAPDGRVTTRLRLNDKYGGVVSSSLPDDQMLILVGDKNLLTIGNLAEHWNPEQIDIQPAEIKDEWEIVNTIAIDIGADLVHETTVMQPDQDGDLQPTPITGEGIMIAVLDSGVFVDKHVKDLLSSPDYATDIKDQFVGQVDFVGDGREGNCNEHDYDVAGGYCSYDWDKSHDPYGHGSHVAGIIWSQITDASTSVSMGIAPGAHVVSVRVLGPDGMGTYEDLIQGIQWVVNNQNNPELSSPIRVMNLSLSAEANLPYFVDPINRAVEQAWAHGIVVLAAAGNEGPEAESITVPGNDPYIITVGAINNQRTPGYWADDFVPTWSASGPTLDGFVKPDVLAPGSQIVSFMHNDEDEVAKLLHDHPDYAETMSLFRMNGTSMATAVTSGVVALMLQADPTLTPDQVKFRLMNASIPAATENGEFHYSPLQQGAGRIWAPEAVLGSSFAVDGVANGGMDISSDLAHDWVMRDGDGSPLFDENGIPVLNEAEMAFHYQGPIRSIVSDDGQYILYFMSVENSVELIVLGGVQAEDMSWVDQQSLDEAALTFTTAGPGQTAWDYGDVWSSGMYNWAGGMYNWAGGMYNWAGGMYNWAGGMYNWAGGMYNWAGGMYNWAGGMYNWAGGMYNWAGGMYNWAGNINNLAGESIGANKWIEDDRPQGYTIHVADLDGSAAWVNMDQWQQTVTITLRDEHQTRIGGAAISGIWSNGGGEVSCFTESNGECTLESPLALNGVSQITFTVSGIEHDTLAYAPTDDIDFDGDSNGSSLMIDRPVHPTVHVNDIDVTSSWINSSQWRLDYMISIVDDQGVPVVDATLNIKWSKGFSGSFSCITNSNGQCHLAVEAVAESIDEVEIQIEDISHWLLKYQSSDNEDADGESNGSKLATEPPSYRPSLHIADLDATTSWISSSSWKATITITVRDDQGNLVQNATISGLWTSGLSGSFDCTTTENGQCDLHAGDLPDDEDQLKLEIINVTHAMLYYVDDHNDDPDDDSNGNNMTIEPPAYRPSIHIADLDATSTWISSSSWNATITITVRDDQGDLVGNATISGLWTSGLSGTFECTTVENGQCEVHAGDLPDDEDQLKLEIINVTHAMLYYVDDHNDDPDDDSNGNNMTIEPPAYRPSIHIADLDATTSWISSSSWNANIMITVMDDQGNLVGNATISGLWTSGLSGTFECTTFENGQCAVPVSELPDDEDQLKFEIIDVTHNLLYYVDDHNDDPDDDSNGDSMTIKPPENRP